MIPIVVLQNNVRQQNKTEEIKFWKRKNIRIEIKVWSLLFSIYMDGQLLIILAVTRKLIQILLTNWLLLFSYVSEHLFLLKNIIQQLKQKNIR